MSAKVVKAAVAALTNPSNGKPEPPAAPEPQEEVVIEVGDAM